jgi:hypothetical protein
MCEEVTGNRRDFSVTPQALPPVWEFIAGVWEIAVGVGFSEVSWLARTAVVYPAQC